MELTKQQKKRITKVGLFSENKDLANFDVIQEIADSLEKLSGAETVRIEGKQGEKGAKGDKGDRGEVGKNGKDGVDGNDGINGKDGKDGKDGKNGIDGKNGKDGKNGVDGQMGKIDDATIGYLENEIKRLTSLIEEAKGTQRTGWGAHPLQIQSAGVIKEKVARVINFVGTAVNSVVRSGSGVVTVTLNAGGVGSTVYNETPTGLIDGNNTTYTTAQTITTVQMLAINGQFIHPSEYVVSGAGFTMNTALDASLTGLSFTIVYV